MFELLELDRIDYLGRKLDKKMFYDNADLSKDDKKIFVDYISRIEMSYVINSKNLNIQPLVNEDYRYESIIYLKIMLKKDDKLDKISKIINNAIPNPLVIVFEFEDKYKISTAIKRLSKSEADKVVIEESRMTTWIGVKYLSEDEEKFLKSISLSGLPYSNLFDFYKVMNDKIYIFEKCETVGKYEDIIDKNKLEVSKNISQKIETLEKELKKTISKLRRESQFNKKMELNVKAFQLKREIEELKIILSRKI
ncbi:MAG: DUF4391 domain-containing protein [Terrisporobacter sp.]